MSCLCGHFEWCAHCATKPDDPEVLRKMTAKDWAVSYIVEIPRHGAACPCKTCADGRKVWAYLNNRLQERCPQELKKALEDEAIPRTPPKNP